MGVREALLRANIATPSEIDEALARQQLYGADIVTNLLELVDVPEATLQHVLGELYGLPLAPGGELPYASVSAIELVPRELATDLSVYPFQLDSGVLTLIASAPLSERTTVDLGFALKVQLRTLFAIAPRVKHAIARDYAFQLDRRTAKALARLEHSRRSQMPDALPPSDGPPPNPEAPRLSQLPRPRSIAPFGFPDSWSDTVTPAMAELYAETARQPEVSMKRLAELAASPETSRSGVSPEPAQLPEWGRPPGGAETPAPQTVAERGVSLPPAAPRTRTRRRGPYTPSAAREDLRGSGNAEEILETFFDFAAQYFDYTAVFALHADWAELRDARGSGTSSSELRERKLEFAFFSALKHAAESSTWLLQNLNEFDPNLAALLRRTTDQISLLLPIRVGNRCIAVLYGGYDTEPVELPAVGELLAFAPLVARAFEHAILARKTKGSVFPTRIAAIAPKRRRFAKPAPEAGARALAGALVQSRDPKNH